MDAVVQLLAAFVVGVVVGWLLHDGYQHANRP